MGISVGDTYLHPRYSELPATFPVTFPATFPDITSGQGYARYASFLPYYEEWEYMYFLSRDGTDSK